MSDFISTFGAHVAEHPDADAVTFLAEDGTAVIPHRRSYGELDARARIVGAYLSATHDVGERVLMLFAPSLGFVEAFLGCLMSGTVAVPAPIPDGREHGMDRLSGIADDAGVNTVLTTSDIAPVVEAWAAGLAVPTTVVAVDTLEGDGTWKPFDVAEDAIAFLQYTSGSTSDPKGVVVTHGNLAANQREIALGVGTDASVRVVGWLPPYHDMGLIGMILHPLFLGGTTTFMSPLTFLKRPILWLKAMSDYRATLSVAPNFAFDFIARRVSPADLNGIELGSVISILNGSEPIQAASIRKFTDLLAPTGLAPTAVMPVYGLAEATLFVTGTPHATLPVTVNVDTDALAAGKLTPPIDDDHARTLVASGVASTLEVAVVDPDFGHEHPTGHIGEIWVRGDSVAHGYWKLPEKSAETFDGALVGRGSGWLRTGDIGAFTADAQLIVTGRIKDMMIVNGRNLYSHDIESAARTVSPAVAVGVGAAFTVGNPERMVLVHEVKPELLGDDTPTSVVAAIRRVVHSQFDAQLTDVVLVPKGSVPRTTSGKIRRVHTRGLYESRALTPLEEVVA